MDNDPLFYNGEARDDITTLPRSAAIRIFSFLNIIDLHRAAQVCRSWKMITNSNVLWSKLDLYPIRDK
jgi:F-box/leucine-rich repeat protein 13